MLNYRNVARITNWRISSTRFRSICYFSLFWYTSKFISLLLHLLLLLSLFWSLNEVREPIEINCNDLVFSQSLYIPIYLYEGIYTIVIIIIGRLGSFSLNQYISFICGLPTLFVSFSDTDPLVQPQPPIYFRRSYRCNLDLSLFLSLVPHCQVHGNRSINRND